LRRRNNRLLPKYSSAIIICPPLLRAEAENEICRFDQIPDTVNPGENIRVRHTSEVGISNHMPLAAYDWVPVSPVPQRHEHYEGATTPTRRITGRLFGSLPVPTRFLRGSCSLLPALPSGWRSRIEPGSLFNRRSPFAGSLPRGREWDISDCMSLSTNEATHPRCESRVARIGRAEPHTWRVSREASYRSFHRNRYIKVA